MSLKERIAALRGHAPAALETDLAATALAAAAAGETPEDEKPEDDAAAAQDDKPAEDEAAGDKPDEDAAAGDGEDGDDEDKPADAAAVAEACAAAGCAYLVGPLIRAGASEAAVAARLAAAHEIRDMVSRTAALNPAVDPKLADDFIRAGASPGHVSRQLLGILHDRQSPDIANTHQPGGAAAPAHDGRLDPSWEAAVEKAGRMARRF